MSDSERADQSGQRHGTNGGSMSVGDRLRHLEQKAEEHEKDDDMKHERIWDAIHEMKLELVKSQTKFAIVLTILTFVGGLAAQWAMKKMGG